MRDKATITGEDLMDLLEEVQEINTVSEFMKDDDVNQVLAQCVKIVSKPDIPPQVASVLIVKMSAMCMLFRVKAKNYMLLEKDAPNASQKKNFYMTISDSLQELINSLKYVTRV